jgi:transposase
LVQTRVYRMAVNFIPLDRETPDWFPETVQEYLPESHLARFVVDIVDQLDLRHLVAAYAGTGSPPDHPARLVALLFYGYTTGVFCSRKRAQATDDSIAFRFICANTHPDHRTLADFRKRFLAELEARFTEIRLIAPAMGVLKLGTVSLDGTKIKANFAREPTAFARTQAQLEAAARATGKKARGPAPSHPCRGRGRRTKSTSPMNNRASCPRPTASCRASMPRPGSTSPPI